MAVILKASNLTKEYAKKGVFSFREKDRYRALDNVTMNIESGKLIGLLGPNGSGKTTFMKIIAGILKPTDGNIEICDHEIGAYTKGVVSFLPDVNYLHSWMKVKDAFNFYVSFFEDFDRKKADEILQFMELSENMSIKEMSKGMAEKLCLTLALSRNAKLYVLDEPLGGIDPAARNKIMDAIIKNYSDDSSVIISTHLVKDIERLFDDIIFIKQGKVILHDEAEELRIKHKKSIDELFIEMFS